jgi:hypothetical protein
MDPLTLALLSTAIKAVADIADQLAKGKITDAQAQDYLKKAADHYNASVANWNATKAPGA